MEVSTVERNIARLITSGSFAGFPQICSFTVTAGGISDNLMLTAVCIDATSKVVIHVFIRFVKLCLTSNLLLSFGIFLLLQLGCCIDLVILYSRLMER